MLRKKYAREGNMCAVTFSVRPEEAGGAESAALVGDFNDWDAAATPMKRTKAGAFEVTVSLERGRDYQFRYMLDGARWDNDWHADKYVPTPFGDSENGVVIV